ncbi:MAG: type B 50S ribosomal protein L31 [Actinomycetota bacterium]
MKPGIHPEYRQVVFEDSQGGQRWLCGSTVETAKTTTWADGNEYPHVLLDISSYTHPFFTGTMTIVDTAGRVERFNKRYGRRSQPTPSPASDAD